MDQQNLFISLSSSGPIPELLDGNQHPAYLTPEDALHRGGLWRDGNANRLLRVQPIGRTVQSENEQKVISLTADTFQVLGLASIDAPLYTLSRVFGAAADEMYEEQTEWRRALMRPLFDPDKVHSLLEETLASRALTYWKPERIETVEELQERRDPEGMYAWGILFAQASFEAWRDASLEQPLLDKPLRVGWSSWFSSHYWDDVEYAANPEPNHSIDWVTWDAWASLTLYFAASEQLVTFPKNLLSQHYRSAYRYGLKMTAPIGDGLLGYCL